MSSGICPFVLFFFFNDTATTEIYTLSLHDALPISLISLCLLWRRRAADAGGIVDLMIAVLTCVMASPIAWEHHYGRSEEHTSELQSRLHLVCRLLLEKKKTRVVLTPTATHILEIVS